MRFGALLILCLSPGVVQAAPTLALPSTATRTAEEIEAMGSYQLPIGPWALDRVATRSVEGEVAQTSWRIRGTTATTLALLAPLRDQLDAEGFKVLFECDTDACGGFDFRFAIDVLPEPDMHVDLGDYRFLSASRGEGHSADFVSLLISRSSDSGYIQMTRIGAAVSDPIIQPAVSPDAIEAAVLSTGNFSQQLDASGSVILGDLTFDTGSVELGDAEFPSLAELADYLKSNPDRRIALVGHTDAEGSLEANILLSRRRAQSVEQRLINAYGVNPAQLSADGVGFLSPRASNLTLEGRTENRRVEAMITSTR